MNGNDGSALTAKGGLCIGGDLFGLCGAARSGAQGTLELLNSASVAAGRGTLVGPGGKIIGSSDLAAEGLGVHVANGGVIAPGVLVLSPQSASRLATATGAPGTLTIHGSLTMSETARLELDLFGPAAAQQDRLVVTGTVALDGVLALNFTNGYAPRQGDVLTFVTVGGAATGRFANVTITGLEPGFQFEMDVTNGAVTLTALNDGVPTTSAPHSLFLPLVARPYGPYSP